MNASLTEMAKGYFRSRVLVAAARLGLADALADRERNLELLATECGVAREPLYRLLRALASFGVVTEIKPQSFVLTPLGQPLRKSAPNSEWAGVVFWGDLLADSWSHLTECIRTGKSSFQLLPAGGASRWSQDSEAPAIF